MVAEGAEEGEEGRGGRACVKMCPECFAVHAAHLQACPECGHVYPETTKVLEVTDGELVELKRLSLEEQQAAKERLRRTRKEEEWAAKSVVELAAIGRRRGYKYPDHWAAKLWSYPGAEAAGLVREAVGVARRRRGGGWMPPG